MGGNVNFVWSHYNYHQNHEYHCVVYNEQINKLYLLCYNYNIDIDECSEGLSGCSDYCSNHIGYFECSCMEGYQLLENNKTCIGKCL